MFWADKCTINMVPFCTPGETDPLLIVQGTVSHWFWIQRDEHSIEAAEMHHNPINAPATQLKLS